MPAPTGYDADGNPSPEELAAETARADADHEQWAALLGGVKRGPGSQGARWQVGNVFQPPRPLGRLGGDRHDTIEG